MKPFVVAALSVSMVLSPLRSFALSCPEISASQEQLKALSLQPNVPVVQQSELYRKALGAYRMVYRQLLMAQKVNRMEEFSDFVRRCNSGKEAMIAMDWNQLSKAMSPEDLQRVKDAIAAQSGGSSVAETVIVVGVGAGVVGAGMLLIGLASGGALIVIPMIGVTLMLVGTTAATSGLGYYFGRPLVRMLTQTRLDAVTQQNIDSIAGEPAKKQMDALVGSGLESSDPAALP